MLDARRAKREAERAERAAKEREVQLRGQVLVDVASLTPHHALCTLDFVVRGYYVDMPFNCKACGKPQVWTAAQQKWWYETVKGDLSAIAVLCRPCRVQERERKSAVRKAHLEGLAKKRTKATKKEADMANGSEESENEPKKPAKDGV